MSTVFEYLGVACAIVFLFGAERCSDTFLYYEVLLLLKKPELGRGS